MPTLWQRNATRTASSRSSAKSTAASATPGQPFNADSTSSSSTLCPRTLTCQHITWSQLANMHSAISAAGKQQMLTTKRCFKSSKVTLKALPVNQVFPRIPSLLLPISQHLQWNIFSLLSWVHFQKPGFQSLNILWQGRAQRFVAHQHSQVLQPLEDPHP